MRCETCSYSNIDCPADKWGYCQLTGDDVTPESVCDQWGPRPDTIHRLGATDDEHTATPT